MCNINYLNYYLHGNNFANYKHCITIPNITKDNIEDLIIRILSDDDFLEQCLYWINLRHIGRKEVKLNEVRRVCQYVYFKISVGDLIKVKEICNKNKFNERTFKKILDTYWETKEIRSSTNRYKQIMCRNEPLKLNQQDIRELIESGDIFREMNL